MIADKVRLNIGARDKAIPGFISVDCDPHVGVSVVADASDMTKWGPGGVDEIYASNILEHFPMPETARVLLSWLTALKPGGILYISVPDFAYAIKFYSTFGMTEWVRNFLWGDQGYKTAFHYAGFDERLLTKMLIDAGFSDIARVKQFNIPGRGQDCSDNVIVLNGEPWTGEQVSLNMVAVK